MTDFTLSTSTSTPQSLTAEVGVVLPTGSILSLDGACVTMAGQSTLLNFGTIFGADDLTLHLLDSGNAIENHGALSGRGVVILSSQSASSGWTHIVNHGTITQSRDPANPMSAAMLLADAAMISNSGRISGVGAQGIVIYDVAGFGSRIVNTGIITCSSQGASAINFLSGADDTVVNTGQIMGNILLGGGNDLFDGIGGTLIGSISGGWGDDIYRVSDSNIRIDDSDGWDTVESTVSFSLTAQLEALYLLGANNINGFGSSRADVISGNAGHNGIFGNDGNDVLTGQNGNDSLFGGRGDDSLYGGLQDDRLHGGSGNDLLSGGDDQDVLTGVQGDDVLWGGNGDDTVTGGSGGDLLWGDAGDDSLAGGRGADNLYGGTEDDTLSGGAGNDQLVGEAGDDLLRGDAGNDVLLGEAGNDTLDGGEGSDTISGGDGADVFVFFLTGHSGIAAAADTIADFEAGTDLINLTWIDADTRIAGNQAFNFIGTADFGAAGQLRWEQDGTDLRLMGDVNGDRVADFSILLTGLTTLAAQDVLL